MGLRLHFRVPRSWSRFWDFFVKVGSIPTALIVWELVQGNFLVSTSLVLKTVIVFAVLIWLFSREGGKERQRLMGDLRIVITDYSKLIDGANRESAVALVRSLPTEKAEGDMKFEESMGRLGNVLEQWCLSIKDRVEHLNAESVTTKQVVQAFFEFADIARAYHNYVVKPLIEATRPKPPRREWVDMFNRFRAVYNDWVREAKGFSKRLEEASGSRAPELESITEEVTSAARYS